MTKKLTKKNNENTYIRLLRQISMLKFAIVSWCNWIIWLISVSSIQSCVPACATCGAGSVSVQLGISIRIQFVILMQRSITWFRTWGIVSDRKDRLGEPIMHETNFETIFNFSWRRRRMKTELRLWEWMIKSKDYLISKRKQVNDVMEYKGAH